MRNAARAFINVVLIAITVKRMITIWRKQHAQQLTDSHSRSE